MKLVEKLSKEELRLERKIYRMTLIPAYIIAALTAVYFIWKTDFGNEAVIILFIFITILLPFSLRLRKIQNVLGD